MDSGWQGGIFLRCVQLPDFYALLTDRVAALPSAHSTENLEQVGRLELPYSWLATK